MLEKANPLYDQQPPYWRYDAAQDALVSTERFRGGPQPGYAVALDTLFTVRDALEWVRQLAEKNWMTKDGLAEFARAAVYYLTRTR